MEQLEEDNEKESGLKVWLVRIVIALVAVGIVVAIGYGLKGLLSGGAPQKKGPTTIKLLPDTPPPPPPPPKEPPKEQPKEQPKQMKQEEQPKPVEQPAPPSEVMKMDGPAGDGPSPFAAGPVTNENRVADTGPVISSKKSLAAFAWYTSKIKSRIEEAIAEKKELADSQYKIIVFVWIASDGKIDRAELQGSSGDPQVDKNLTSALTQLKPLGEAPPGDMPLPVKLRITSKSMG